MMFLIEKSFNFRYISKIFVECYEKIKMESNSNV
jgi:hypothetical protein